MFAWRAIRPADIVAAVNYLNRAEDGGDGHRSPTINGRLEPRVDMTVTADPKSDDWRAH